MINVTDIGKDSVEECNYTDVTIKLTLMFLLPRTEA